MNAFRHVSVRSAKLARSEEEGEVLVIVQAPHTVGTCGFQLVCDLDLAYKNQVLLEDFVDSSLQIILSVDSHFEQTEHKDNEV